MKDLPEYFESTKGFGVLATELPITICNPTHRQPFFSWKKAQATKEKGFS